MAFDLPELPYAYDALAAGGMSQETMEFHHDLHHKAYVDNGNKLIAGTEWENKSLEQIITGTYDLARWPRMAFSTMPHSIGTISSSGK